MESGALLRSGKMGAQHVGPGGWRRVLGAPHEVGEAEDAPGTWDGEGRSPSPVQRRPPPGIPFPGLPLADFPRAPHLLLAPGRAAPPGGCSRPCTERTTALAADASGCT
jgi:hypothetical protein